MPVTFSGSGSLVSAATMGSGSACSARPGRCRAGPGGGTCRADPRPAGAARARRPRSRWRRRGSRPSTAAATWASTPSYPAGSAGFGAVPWPGRSTAIVSRPQSASRSSQPGCRQLCSAEEAKPCTSRTGGSWSVSCQPWLSGTRLSSVVAFSMSDWYLSSTCSVSPMTRSVLISSAPSRNSVRAQSMRLRDRRPLLQLELRASTAPPRRSARPARRRSPAPGRARSPAPARASG